MSGGSPGTTELRQQPGTRDPGSGFAEAFFNSLGNLPEYPRQYPGQLDPGLSPTMENAIRMGQGYASSGPPEILAGASGALGKFMSPQFQNPMVRAPMGYPAYFGDLSQRIFGGGTAADLGGGPGVPAAGGFKGGAIPGQPPTGGGPQIGARADIARMLAEFLRQTGAPAGETKPAVQPPPVAPLPVDPVPTPKPPGETAAPPAPPAASPQYGGYTTEQIQNNARLLRLLGPTALRRWMASHPGATAPPGGAQPRPRRPGQSVPGAGVPPGQSKPIAPPPPPDATLKWGGS